MCSSLYFHKSIQRLSVSFTTDKNVSTHWQNALRFSQFPSTVFSRQQPLDVLYPYRALSLLIEDFCHSQISQERPDTTTRRGLEPPTSSVTGWRSSLLIYRAKNGNGGTRTHNHVVNSHPLCLISFIPKEKQACPDLNRNIVSQSHMCYRYTTSLYNLPKHNQKTHFW